MARIRSLKPTIWESEQIGDVSIQARLTFIGLITQSDDHGRLKGSPKLVRSWVFPYDDFTLQNVSEWLRELAEAGLIHWFKVDGKDFIELPTWSAHQRVSHPTESVLPSRSEADSEVTPEPLRNPREEPYREGKGREGIGEEGKGKEPTTVPAAAVVSTPDIAAVFDHWVVKLEKPRAKLTPGRRDKIRARLKDGTTVDEMRLAIDGCANSEFHRSNGHTDLELILRSRENVEKFIDRRSLPSRPATAEERGMDNARHWAAEAERLEQLERGEAA